MSTCPFFSAMQAATVPQTAICATIALLSPTDSLEATHMHLQISPITQHPTLKRGKSGPAIAQTAPWKMTSKAALMPACGEDQQVAAPMHQRERSRSSRPRPAAHRWWSSRQSIDDAAAHHQPLAATLSCPRPPNLPRPVRIDSTRSVTSEIRVRASSSA